MPGKGLVNGTHETTNEMKVNKRARETLKKAIKYLQRSYKDGGEVLRFELHNNIDEIEPDGQWKQFAQTGESTLILTIYNPKSDKRK